MSANAAQATMSLEDAVLATAHDPLAFTLLNWPWGVKGTVLEHEDGPDDWQSSIMRLFGEQCRERRGVVDARPLRLAVASGHGIGKTATIAMLVIWFMATRPNPQVIVTANTGDQLAGKTWRELAKWHQLSHTKSWFTWTATKFAYTAQADTWAARAQTWSAERAEAFAGLHEAHVLVVYDEASRIDDIIWETTDGAMTTPGAMWLAFGNPTLNTGRFKECFGRFRHRWLTRQIDSRTARHANRAEIDQWIEDWGEDSDYVRVRVRGVFPRQAAMQFISGEDVDSAVAREVLVPAGAPRLLGVDVARFGDDQTVLARRHGRKLEPLERHRGLDVMQVAARVAEVCAREKPDTVFVDGVGLGAGVVDRLHQLGFACVEVLAGAKPDTSNADTHANKRAEMWDRMRTWIKGADIPDDKALVMDFIGPEYGFDDKQRMRLERKEDMKKRGLASPDAADALALTFAHLTPPRVDVTSADMEPEAEAAY